MNVIVIRCDQARHDAFGCYGNTESQTPNIDLLAGAGVRYENAYSTEPECSASRTGFDVGKHTHATPNAEHLHPGDRTIHGLLESDGVDTIVVGKWHKTPDDKLDPSEPQRVPPCMLRGIRWHVGHEHKHELVLGPYWENGGGPKLTSGPWRPETYTDAFIARLALLEPPFYAVLDLEPPHTPYNVLEGTVWDVFTPGQLSVPPNVTQGIPAAKIDLASYYGMLLSVDDMVGQVMQALGDLLLLGDTMVIFTSDHGGHVGSHNLFGVDEQKRSIYREAIRIPLIVRYPGASTTGVELEPFGTMHFHPFILEQFGLAPGQGLHAGKEPEGLFFMQLDGANTLKGPWCGILLNGHRYARAEQTGPWKLYHESDPFDLDNLVGQGDPLEAALDDALEAAADAVGFEIPW
jgi:arylsulfatase A-like enzyme